MKEKLLLTTNKEYWTFPSYRNKGINSIVDYPAMMIDVMQEELLDAALSKLDSPNTLLDPFHGAGTALIIAQKKGMKPIGIDINPLANIIAQVKLYEYDINELVSSSKSLFLFIQNNDNFEIINFAGIEKWFREDIIRDLSKIRCGIIHEADSHIRKFFWVCFSRIVRKYSNSRSSTFKLHIKEQKNIATMINSVIDDFVDVVKDNISKMRVDYKKNPFLLYCGDSNKELDRINDSSIDIICTSPPYGDNGTTITYGQFSTLQLKWIDEKDLDETTKTINAHLTSIDSSSLGGKHHTNVTELEVINKYLEKISVAKKSKIADFIDDYCRVFKKMVAKLKVGGFLILTIGNRKVDNKSMPFDKANLELATKNDLEFIQRLSRKIVNKRMASKLSHLSSVGSVESMKEETILIFRKKGESNER